MIDLKFAFRQLLKNPGFTGVAVLTLALGIGVNTAIFTLANFALFGTSSAERPDELVSVFFGDAQGRGTSNHSYADYLDYRLETTDVLSGIAAFTPVPANLLVGQTTERVSVGLVSDNYFSVLGFRAMTGRAFLPNENQAPGAHPVVVISEGLWRRQFASNPDLADKVVSLNNATYTVIGVVPESATRMVAVVKTDVFVPAMMQGVLGQGTDYLSERGNKEFLVVGRLRPGATLAQAQSRFNLLATQLASQYPKVWADQGQARPLTLVPQGASQLPFELRGYVVGFVGLLLGVVAAVLLIACANIANFLLARATARRREIAIRLALGASRRRIIRQLLTESLLLSMTGGAAGLLVALVIAALLQAFVPSLGVPLAFDLDMDLRVFAFNLVVTLSTAFAFGLAPALQASRPQVVTGLKDGEPLSATGLRRFALRNLLVVGQVSASLALLLCAGMFLRSLGKLHSIELGFNADSVALLSVDLALEGFSPERGNAFHQQAIERLQRLPGVVSVDVARRVPVGLSKVGQQFIPEGNQLNPEEAYFGFNLVGPRYFETMQIPLLRGRGFSPQDRDGAPRVAVINQTLSERLWPGEDPVGKRLFQDTGASFEIIGICKPSKYHSLTEGPTPFVYLPILQHHQSALTFHVRTHGSPETMLHSLRQELLSLDPTLVIFDVKTMNEHLTVSMLPVRVGATLVGSFGALALGLAVLGLYGVMSYVVTRRTREIGIRVALGARHVDVLMLILRQGMTLTFIGVCVGLLLGSSLAAAVASQLYGISHADLPTLAGAPLVLIAVALLACLLPARRAARVDPMVALRSE